MYGAQRERRARRGGSRWLNMEEEAFSCANKLYLAVRSRAHLSLPPQPSLSPCKTNWSETAPSAHFTLREEARQFLLKVRKSKLHEVLPSPCSQKCCLNARTQDLGRRVQCSQKHNSVKGLINVSLWGCHTLIYLVAQSPASLSGCVSLILCL